MLCLHLPIKEGGDGRAGQRAKQTETAAGLAPGLALALFNTGDWRWWLVGEVRTRRRARHSQETRFHTHIKPVIKCVELDQSAVVCNSVANKRRFSHHVLHVHVLFPPRRPRWPLLRAARDPRADPDPQAAEEGGEREGREEAVAPVGRLAGHFPKPKVAGPERTGAPSSLLTSDTKTDRAQSVRRDFRFAPLRFVSLSSGSRAAVAPDRVA